MEFRELSYFIAAYEHNSFTKAAEQLHLTQQGISKAVAKLENEFGTALFVRKKTALQPIEFGNVFYEKTKHPFTEYQKTMDSLKGEAPNGSNSHVSDR